MIDVNSNLNTSKKRDEFWSGFASGNSERKFAASEAKSALMSNDARNDANAFYDWIYDPEAGSASPQDAQLDKRGATVTPAKVLGDKSPDITRIKDTKQVSRWRLKHGVCNILRSKDSENTPSVCKCGTAGFQSDEVSLTRNGNRASVKGVFYCDSPWLCPTCAPRRAAERAAKVSKVFKAAEKKKGQIVFVTMTVAHSKKDDLATLKKLVTDAGSMSRKGNPWALAKKKYDIVGTLVSPEVTYSLQNGWHFHLHLALIVLNEDQEKAQEAGEWLIGRYMSYVTLLGGKTSRKAQDVTVVWREEDLAAYMSKGSAAWEIASSGSTKNAASGSLTPWDLVALGNNGDAKSANLFLEYAAVMPGTKSCVITKTIADVLGIKAEDDQDVEGVEEVEENDEVVGVMEPYRWHRILRNGYAADILKVTAAGWCWSDIDYLISRMLKEPETTNAYREKSQVFTSVVNHTYQVSDEEFAMKVAARSVAGSGRKLGASIQMQIQAERDYAEARSKHFIMPNLKNVMQILSA